MISVAYACLRAFCSASCSCYFHSVCRSPEFGDIFLTQGISLEPHAGARKL